MKTLGNIIYEKRQQLGLSQRQLARKLGVTNVSLCRWEQGDCVPNIYNCWDLADVFHCTIDELCGRSVSQLTPMCHSGEGENP